MAYQDPSKLPVDSFPPQPPITPLSGDDDDTNQGVQQLLKSILGELQRHTELLEDIASKEDRTPEMFERTDDDDDDGTQVDP